MFQRSPAVLLMALVIGGCPNTTPTAENPPKLTITGITLSKTALTLNAKPISGSVAPGYVVEEQLTASVQASDNATHSITWASSDTSRVIVTDGLVSTVANAPEGTVSITATSVDDTTKSATAIVTVTRIGDASLGVE